MYDGVEAEIVIDREKNSMKNYYELIKEKLVKLKEYSSKLDQDILQENPELLKNILNSVSLKFGGLLDLEPSNLSKMKEKYLLMKYHADISEAHVILTEKLSCTRNKA